MNQLEIDKNSTELPVDPILWLLDWVKSPEGKRFLGLCKHRLENYQALKIVDLSSDDSGCKTSLLIGNLGAFGKKPRLAFAKEFEPGGTYVLIGDVSADSPPITTNDLPSLVKQAYQTLNSDRNFKVFEWAKGVFA